MTKRRRLIELGKDVLIVLLLCSAFWLAAQNQLLEPFTGLFRGEEVLPPEAGQTQTGDRAEAARPLRMAVSLSGGAEEDCFGVLYDEEACGALFEQVAGVLAEALSSAGEPETIDRRQWENTLGAASSVLLDFQGSVPLSVLSGWLSGTEIGVDVPVRRLVIAVQEDAVVLCCRNESDGSYLRLRSQVADPLHLARALASLTENGAFYAFQSETYTALDPDTLLLPEAPAPAAYVASNPMSGGQADLEELMEDLGLSINANGVYRGADGEWVARSGGGTLRLSDGGVAVYEAGEGAEERFALPGGAGASLFEQVEVCRRTAAAALGGRSGQGRLYLLSAAGTEEGLEVRFGLSLNGVPVLSEEGSAARFLVREGRVVRFELRFRSYTALEETTAVMPPRQAVAALEAQGLEGEELLLIYTDTGGDRVEASWAANRRPAGEG